MTVFPSALIRRLKASPMPRHRIADELGVPKHIGTMLQRKARHLTPPHVVERRRKGQKHEVEYRLRPAVAGEKAGTIFEVDVFEDLGQYT